MSISATPGSMPLAEAVAGSTPARPLRGGGLWVARSVWALALLTSLTIYGAVLYRSATSPMSLRAIYADAFVLSSSLWMIGVPPDWMLPINDVAAVAWYIVFPCLCYGVGLLIFWRRSTDWTALLVATMLVAMGPLLTGLFWYAEADSGVMGVAAVLLALIGVVTFLFAPFVFPDGRFVPGWLWVVPTATIVVTVVLSALSTVADHPMVAAIVPAWLLRWGGLALLLTMVVGATNQVYRYVHVSTATQRQQTRWVVLGLSLSLVLLTAVMLTGSLSSALWEHPWNAPLLFIQGKLLLDLIGLPALMLLPLSFGLSVLRAGLWGIDPLINRTLVYGLLTTSIFVLYALVVGGLGLLFQANGGQLIALLATGAVAVAVQPARQWLQRGVNRLMYGDRDDPYAVLAGLGQRLDVSLTPEVASPIIVQTVREALKLPAVAITIPADRAEAQAGDEAADEVVAAAGTLPPDAATLPLTYGGEPVGRLLYAPRAGGEPLSRADRRLLDDVARLAGLALHVRRLTHDLRRSRQRLVTTREEERRRLRRDLHDGLGANLAALNLQIGALRPAIGSDPAAAAARVPELQEQVRAAIGDIRHLVYGLRPPALDELGLVGALRARADQWAGDTGLRLTIDAPPTLGTLPAAVEVAAYRIVSEALTNVLRHAQAVAVTVRLVSTEDALQVEVVDDGVGLPAERWAGVGLRSMRERAEEVGGSCVIEPAAGGGTRVAAHLPLPQGE